MEDPFSQSTQSTQPVYYYWAYVHCKTQTILSNNHFPTTVENLDKYKEMGFGNMNYLESSQEENDGLMEILAEMHVRSHHDDQHSSRASLTDGEADDSTKPNNDAQRNVSGTTDNIAFPSGSLYEELIKFQRQHSIDGSDEDVTSVLSVATTRDGRAQGSTDRITSQSVVTMDSRPRRQSASALTTSDQYLLTSNVRRRASTTSNTPGRSTYRPPVPRHHFRVLSPGKCDSGEEDDKNIVGNHKGNLRLSCSQHDRKSKPATDVVLLRRNSLQGLLASASSAAYSDSILHQGDFSANIYSPQDMPTPHVDGSPHGILQNHNSEDCYLSHRATGLLTASASFSSPLTTNHVPYDSRHHHHHQAVNQHHHFVQESDEALARRLQEEFDRHHQSQLTQHSQRPAAEDAIYNRDAQSSIGPRCCQDNDYFSPTRSCSTDAVPVSTNTMTIPESSHQFQSVQGCDAHQDILESQRQAEQRFHQERQDFQYAMSLAKMQQPRRHINSGNAQVSCEETPPLLLSFSSSIGSATTVSLTEQDSSFDSLAPASGAYGTGGWVQEAHLY